MFLTDADLLELTGYKSRHHQRQWLSARGYKHAVARGGRPVVAVDEVRRKLIGRTGGQEKQLNLAALGA